MPTVYFKAGYQIRTGTMCFLHLRQRKALMLTINTNPAFFNTILFSMYTICFQIVKKKIPETFHFRDLVNFSFWKLVGLPYPLRGKANTSCILIPHRFHHVIILIIVIRYNSLFCYRFCILFWGFQRGLNPHDLGSQPSASTYSAMESIWL